MGEHDRHPIVLIVEDDPRTLEALKAVFRSDRWHVRMASTTAEAVALLDSGFIPDGLILDLMLPDGTGNIVLERVRARGLRTGVAVVTGTTNPFLLSRAEELKPDLLLIKPIDPEALARLIEDWSELAG